MSEGTTSNSKNPPQPLQPPSLAQHPDSRMDCPICMLVLPLDPDESIYQSCCGKIVCRGCANAATLARAKADARKQRQRHEKLKPPETALCAFCRAEAPANNREYVAQLRSRAELDDIWALHNLANLYSDGRRGLPKSRKKALELYQRMYDMGSAEGAFCLAYMYDERVVGANKGDREKEREYLEEAARRGHVDAEVTLGQHAHEAGDGERAARHFIKAAEAGDDQSLNHVKEYFRYGFVSKDDFASTLRAHQAATNEVKSENRELAKRFRTSL